MIDDFAGPRLARYISGDCSPEEEAEIRDWIDSDPERVELVEELRRVWEMSGRREVAWDVDAAWERLLAARAAHRTTGSGVPSSSAEVRGARQGGGRAWWLSAAAVILVAIGAVLLWGRLGSERGPVEMVASQEFVTGRGERLELNFPDGSRVLLAPDTRLRVADRFGRRGRDVHLEGQGLFEVAHDPRRPFRVHTEQFLTEVLGTEFVVRAYADEQVADVALIEGSVQLMSRSAPPSEPLVLAPGEVGQSVEGRQLERVGGENLDARLGWIHGRLEFQDTPLREAARELGRWYDLDIRFADPGLANRRLTASFQGESAARVIEVLALSLDVRYSRDGSTVVLSPR